MKYRLILILFFISITLISDGQSQYQLQQTGTFQPVFLPLKAAPEKYGPTIVKHKTTITNYIAPAQPEYKLDSINENVPLVVVSEKLLQKRKKCKFLFKGKKIDNQQIESAPKFIFKDVANKNIKYTDKNHGFFSNSITDMVQDIDGNIWTGSDGDGLCKLSGCRTNLYTTENGLPSNSIIQVVFDKHNNIWIGTANGVCYIRNDSIFTCNALENKNISVRDMFEDSKGNIWISTMEKGAYRYSNSEIEIFDDNTGLTENYINDAMEDKRGNIWFGTNGCGFIKYDFTNFHQYYSSEKYKFNLSMFFLDNDDLWICEFQKGFLKQINGSFYRYHYTKAKRENIYDVQKNKNSLWIADYANGLFKFSGNKFTHIGNNDGFSASVPYDLLIDYNSNIWISTMFSGIFRFDENQFISNDTKTGIPIGIAEGMEYDKEGNLWFLPNGNKILKYNGSDYKIYDDKIYNLGHVWDAVFTKNNKMWAATYSKGICNVSDDFISYYQDNGVNVIFDLELVGDSIIYAATLDRGLIKFDFKNFYYINEKQGLKNNQVDNIFYSANNELWIAVKNSGISILKNGALASFNMENGLCSNNVTFICEDSQYNKWIGTERGLNIIRGNKIFYITKKNGLISNNVKSVLQTKSNIFWIATDKGISKIEFENELKYKINNYNRNYGMNISDFNSTVRKLNTGEIYWSTNSNLVKFNPESERKHENAPLFTKKCVFFNDSISVFNDDYLHEVLPSEKLKIDFCAIDWGYENELKYRYSLSNHKETFNWIEIGSRHDIVFMNIQPGEYYLHLQAEGLQGKSKILEYKIKFQPKWNQTVWFKILVIFFIILLVFLIVYLRISRLKKNEKSLNLLVAEKTKQLEDDKIILNEKNVIIETERQKLISQNEIIEQDKSILKSKNEQIAEQNKYKDSLLQEIHHRVKNNMQLISSIIDMQIRSHDDQKNLADLFSIQNRINSMTLVHEMLYSGADQSSISSSDYLNKLIKSIYEITNREYININLNVDIQEIQLNLNDCISLGMITGEAVSNSIKYAFKNTDFPEIKIILKADANNQIMDYLICDNGSGISNEINSNNNKTLGMRLINIFAKQMNAKLNIAKNNGTEIRLIIPIKENTKA